MERLLTNLYNSIIKENVSIPFKREGAWKETRKRMTVPKARSFNSLQTGRSMESQWEKHNLNLHLDVSIPFKREGAWKETLFSTQTGRGSKHPKTKHELRGAFFG